jgi:hypothetical protein
MHLLAKLLTALSTHVDNLLFPLSLDAIKRLLHAIINLTRRFAGFSRSLFLVRVLEKRP